MTFWCPYKKPNLPTCPQCLFITFIVIRVIPFVFKSPSLSSKNHNVYNYLEITIIIIIIIIIIMIYSQFLKHGDTFINENET